MIRQRKLCIGNQENKAKSYKKNIYFLITEHFTPIFNILLLNILRFFQLIQKKENAIIQVSNNRESACSSKERLI